jgi:hypothetical protein
MTPKRIKGHCRDGYGGGDVASDRARELVRFVFCRMECLGKQIRIHGGSIRAVKLATYIGDVRRSHQRHFDGC